MADFRVSIPSARPRGKLQDQAKAGLKPILQNLNAFVNMLEGVTEQAMIDAVEPTMELSDKYTPKFTGDLVNSRYVDVTRSPAGRRVRIELGYNRNGEAPYAIFVHEMLGVYHDAPTQAKFLQRALDEDSDNLLDRIVDNIQEAVGL